MENSSAAQPKVAKEQLIVALTAAAINQTDSPGEAVAVLIRVATNIMGTCLEMSPAQIYAAFDEWINEAVTLANPAGQA